MQQSLVESSLILDCINGHIEYGEYKKNVVQRFISRHDSNEIYFNEIEYKIEAWLENVKEESNRILMLGLLEEFQLISKLQIKQMLLENLQLVMNEFTIDDFLIIPLPSQNGKMNSSHEMLSLLREVIREYQISIYQDTLKTVFHKGTILNEIPVYVIFDDFSGTGKTIVDFVRHNINLLRGKILILAFLVITKSAEEMILQLKKEITEIDIRLLTRRLITHVTDTNEVIRNNIHHIKNIEVSLWGNYGDFVLGYKSGKYCIGFSHNIPNNTFSSMWYHDDFGRRKNWNTLFKRFIQPKRKKRQNYNLKGRR